MTVHMTAALSRLSGPGRTRAAADAEGTRGRTQRRQRGRRAPDAKRRPPGPRQPIYSTDQHRALQTPTRPSLRRRTSARYRRGRLQSVLPACLSPAPPYAIQPVRLAQTPPQQPPAPGRPSDVQTTPATRLRPPLADLHGPILCGEADGAAPLQVLGQVAPAELGVELAQLLLGLGGRLVLSDPLLVAERQAVPTVGHGVTHGERQQLADRREETGQTRRDAES